MHWSAYEVFSVISGVILIVVALAPGDNHSARFWSGLGGAALIIYGIWVAKQTSGTYYFSIWIFIIPVAAVIYLWASRTDRSKSSDTSNEPPRPTPRSSTDDERQDW